MALEASIRLIRACGYLLLRTETQRKSSGKRSEAYFAAPVAFSSASLLTTGAPT